MAKIPKDHKVLLDTNILLGLAVTLKKFRSMGIRNFIRRISENTKMCTLDSNFREFMSIMRDCRLVRGDIAQRNYANNLNAGETGVITLVNRREIFEVNIINSESFRGGIKSKFQKVLNAYNKSEILKKAGLSEVDKRMWAYASITLYIRIISRDMSSFQTHEVIMEIDRLNGELGIARGLNIAFYPSAKSFWKLVGSRGL